MSANLTTMCGLKSKDRSDIEGQVDNKMSRIAMDGLYSKGTGVLRVAS